MDKNGFLALLFLFIVLADPSFAWNFRKLIAGAVPNSGSPSGTQNTSLPSSGPSEIELKPRVHNGNKVGGDEGKNAQITNTPSNPVSNDVVDNQTSSSRPATVKQKDPDKDHGVKGKNDNAANSQSGSSAGCKGSLKSCSDQSKTMTACIKDSGSKEAILLVQNVGDQNLKVNYVASAMGIPMPDFDVPSHQSREINIPKAGAKITKIIVNAGIGSCELDMSADEFKGSFVEQLSFYSQQVTPIYGVYLSFMVALVLGGSWACCKLRKRRFDGGVPYQELEMGLPESSTAASLDSAEGWDQDWDDDWDEDNAVKSPGGCNVGGISANSLTSRSSKRDG